MGLTSRNRFGWIILAVFAVLSALWLRYRNIDARISTDVLDLIPSAERSPELSLVRELASQAEAKVMLFTVTQPGAKQPPAAAAAEFSRLLRADSAFAESVSLDDPDAKDAIGKAVFDQRFELIFPTWLEKNRAALPGLNGAALDQALAARAADHLTHFLETPEAVAFQDLVPQDPLVLVPDLVATPGLSDSFFGSAKLTDTARVWARISASPLTPEGQDPVFRAIENAKTRLAVKFPGTVIVYTGVNRFAAASKTRIEREFSLINLLSLVAVVAVAGFFLKGAYRALHLIPPIAIAVLGAWVAVASAFDRIHILVFVVGSLLTGVAIDYGFYIFLQPPAFPGESYGQKIRRIREPLLASCITTVLGFALLVFSELPLIRQLGVFVGAGLITALGAALLYFSGLKNPYLETKARNPSRSGARPWTKVVLAVVWIVATAGLMRVKWNDDIRQLQIPTPSIEAEDEAVHTKFGDSGERTVWLTQGQSLTQARDHLDDFNRWLAAQPGAQQPFSLGVLIPSERTWADAVAFVHSHPGFGPALRDALAKAGFDADALAPFFQAYDSYSAKVTADGWAGAVDHLSTSIGGPAGLLIHRGSQTSWFVTITTGPVPSATPPAEVRTIPVDELQSLNTVFQRYRRSAVLLSTIGLGILGLGVLVTYGLREGIRIFAIPCGTCFAIFGLWGWTGHPLNLFHLLGAFLGVCLTHNYSIFSANSARHGQAAPMSVRLSALCAAASFGVLGLSAIPAVKALGLTVASMALAALLAIECEHFRAKK